MTQASPGEEGQQLRDRAFLNAAANILGTAVTLLVWFGVTSVILHHLPVAEFGLWALSTTLAAYIPLIDLGIGDALTRYIAASRARGAHLEANRWIASGLRIYLALGAITLLLTAAIAPFFADLFHMPRGEAGLATPVVALTGLNAALVFPSYTNLAILQGAQRFDLINIVSIGSTLAIGGVTVAVMLAGGNVVALAAIAFPTQLLAQIPMVLFIRRAAPEVKLRWSLADRHTVRGLLSFGGAQAIVRGSRQARYYADQVIIGAIQSVRLLTPYAVIQRLAAPAGNLTDQLLDTLLPLVSHLHAREDRSRLREVLLVGTRASVGMFLMVAVSVALLAEPFIRFWAGSRYLTHSSIAPLLLAGVFTWTLMAPAENLLAGMRELRVPMLSATVSLVVKIGLAIGLGLSFGLVGVAASGVIAGLVTALPVLAAGLRAAELPLTRLAREGLGPALVASLLAAAAVMGCRAAIGEGSLPIVLVDGAAGSVAFAAVYLAAPPAGLERMVIARALAPLLKRAGGGA